MNNITSFLAEWTIDYIKNKDIFIKKVESIEKNKDGFDIVVKYKDKVSYFIVKPSVEDIEEVTGKKDKEGHYTLVMLNNKENLHFIIRNWKRLVDFKNLCIIFVNPFSQLDKKWLVFPYIHNRICDDSSLERGFKAMFETVEAVTEDEMKVKLKQRGN